MSTGAAKIAIQGQLNAGGCGFGSCQGQRGKTEKFAELNTLISINTETF